MTTLLTDPDEDGLYTGRQIVPSTSAGQGGPPEPITLSPVQIVQGPPTGSGPLGPEYRVIEDFGAVVAEDKTLSASVSFCEDNGGETTGGGGEGTTEAPAGGAQYEDGGTAASAGIDLNEDGAVSEADDEFAAETSERGVAATPEEGVLPGTGAGLLLPSTGGVLPIAGVAGLVIVAGGLLARRKFAR